MDKTRPFCAERAGNFYTDKEIKSWAKEDWKGKNPNTTESSIFYLCGGYNCTHQLIPVHESLVPDDVKKLAAERGFYKMAA